MTAPRTLPTLVFLHIPKTAGQTVHNALADLVGADRVSPVRVHTQAQGDAPQMPPGYGLYSGHLDWTELETLPADRFVFTVLRDPCERIASFYFYLLAQAQTLGAEELATPARTGMRMIRTQSAEAYFFGGDRPWQRFVLDHYDNFYCAYFASRKMRGRHDLRDLDRAGLVAAAEVNLPLIDRIYSTLDLGALEADIAARTGQQIAVANRYVNRGQLEAGEARWPKLLERFESDAAARRLEAFVEADYDLIERLGLKV